MDFFLLHLICHTVAFLLNVMSVLQSLIKHILPVAIHLLSKLISSVDLSYTHLGNSLLFVRHFYPRFHSSVIKRCVLSARLRYRASKEAIQKVSNI